jgi:hypothetical protein
VREALDRRGQFLGNAEEISAAARAKYGRP